MTSFWIFGTAIFTFLIPRCSPSTSFPPQFWKLSPTLFCPLQLLGPAKQPMAGPSSCKGQNKVRNNFQNCDRKVQCILSIVCLQASIILMLLCKLYIFWKKVSTILSNCVHFLHKKVNLHKKFTFFCKKVSTNRKLSCTHFFAQKCTIYITTLWVQSIVGACARIHP